MVPPCLAEEGAPAKGSPLALGRFLRVPGKGELCMSPSPALLPGVSARNVATSRLQTYLLEAGSSNGTPILFVHGNASSSRFFEETLAALDPKLHALAPDLRGFGASQAAGIDATRGLRDF